MARMHSRDKGKSGSTKPSVKIDPSWIRYSTKEIEMLIVKYAKEGKSSSEIGIILRDSYGIPDVRHLMGKRITEILAEKKLLKDLPEDMRFLMLRALSLRKHLEANKQDMTAKRGLQLTESKILRLVKYYKKSGKLDVTWKYNPKNITMYV